MTPLPPLQPSRHHRVVDALLTAEPVQRLRLAQVGLAAALMLACVAAMQYFVWVGVAPAVAAQLWSLVSLGGMAVFFALVRSGWSRGRRDPTLTRPLMVFTLASGAAAYALLGNGRGSVLPIVMLILALGMFQLRPRELRQLSWFAVLLFGTAMALMAWWRPEVYPPRVELGHFMLVALSLPAMAILADRLSRLRSRLHERQDRLTHALARIQDLATHDALTGLVNRRHMTVLLEQEHQRGVRSGHTFCIAAFDVDGFKAFNARHGYAAGDAMLQALAREMQSVMRVSDALARWGGGQFVLLLADTRAPLARGGVERMREHVAQHADAGVPRAAVTLSAGLVEHRAGESVAQTLERAEQALAEAKAQGRDRVVIA